MTLLTLLNQAGPPPPARSASGGGSLTLGGGGIVGAVAAPSLPGALQRLRRRQAALGPKVHRPWRRAPNTAQGGGVLELQGGGELAIATHARGGGSFGLAGGGESTVDVRARGGGVFCLEAGAQVKLGDNPEEIALFVLVAA